MAFSLKLEERTAYLHAVVTGDNTKDDVVGYLQALIYECRLRGTTRVLIEERLTGPRLGPVDLFDIAARGSNEAAGLMHAIAFVDIYAVDNAMKFAENVAVNRGLPIRMFDSVTDAEVWLAGL